MIRFPGLRIVASYFFFRKYFMYRENLRGLPLPKELFKDVNTL